MYHLPVSGEKPSIWNLTERRNFVHGPDGLGLRCAPLRTLELPARRNVSLRERMRPGGRPRLHVP